MKKFLFLIAVAIVPSFAHAATRAQALMGTVCEITVPDSVAYSIDTAFAEGKRIEAMISTWRDDSELARFNAGDANALSKELASVLSMTMMWAKDTGGAFNPLVRPLIDAWKTRDGGAVPTKEALAEAMKRVDLANVETPRGVVAAVKNGALFEEGAWGKGLAIDRMLIVLRGAGATRARINFGGQVGQFGDQPFIIIANPQQRDKPAVAVNLARFSISTSSGSEKVFTVDGRTFTHLIDPRTGVALPPRGSVSVLSDSAMQADILSTALYVMGPEAGLYWARSHNVAAIFITEKNEVLVSEPMPSLQALDAKFTIKR